MPQKQDIRRQYVTELIKDKIMGVPVKSKTARLREFMPQINQKVLEGAAHHDIIAALEEAGMTISRETFRKILYRYRREMKEGRAAPEDDDTKGTAVSPSIQSTFSPPKQAPAPIPIAVSDEGFEDALDPERREELADKYVNAYRPRFGRNKKRVNDQ